MIPKIIHFIGLKSKGATRSPGFDVLKRSMQAARDLHPDWEIRLWDEATAPDGFRLAGYWEHANSAAQLADLMRIEIVHRYGGVFLDWDEILKKPLDDLADATDFFIASENGDTLSNGVFGACAGHEALEKLIQTLLISPPDWSLPPNMTTGPSLFARTLKWHKDIAILPRESFYPYYYTENPRPGHKQTYGEQLWLGSWTNESFGKSLRRRLSAFRPRRLIRSLYRMGSELFLANEYAIRLLTRREKIYSSVGDVVRQTIHGHRILLNGEDLSITPEIASVGYYELTEEIFLRRVLRGGDFFIDVGANVGVFSLLAASLVGSFGRVFSYEPNPVVASLLERSSAMNWMHERLHVRQAAVGARSGQAQLLVNRHRLGDAAVGKVDRGETAGAVRLSNLTPTHSVSVPVMTLDEEFPYDIPIKILKIDAEGFETDVLSGADRLLTRQCIDYVMLEAIEEASGDRWTELLAALELVCAKGYEPFNFGKHGKLLPTTLQRVAHNPGRGRNIMLKSKVATS